MTRHSMRHLLWALLGLCLAAMAAAQTQYTDDDIRRMVRESPRFSEFPEAGAVVLLEQVVHEVNSDGSAVTSEHFLVKILRDRGKTKFADLKRTYNLKTDSMEVLLAQTRRRIGAPIPVEKDAINDITPPEFADAAVYADFHQRVISYPEVAPNMCLELKRRTYHRADETGSKYFWGIATFQGDEPIMVKEYTVVVPKGLAFSYKATGDVPEPLVSEKGGKKAYTWRVEKAPQIIAEPNMPPEMEPRLLYSSCPSWEALGMWLGEQFREKVQPNLAIQAKAAELTKGLGSEEDKVRAVYLWLASSVRNVSLPLGVTGYAPHPAAQVLENMYGDWRDKATLLTALLGAVGVRADVAFVKRNGAALLSDIPTPKQLDAIYVRAVLRSGQVLWLDPFAEDCRYGYFPGGDGTQALAVTEKGGELVTVPPFSAEVNSFLLRGGYTFAGDGALRGSEEFRLDGAFDRRLRSRVKDLTPKELEQLFDQAASRVGEGTAITTRSLSNLKDLTAPSQLTWAFDSPDYAVAEGDMMICPLPPVGFDFLEATPYRPTLQERKYPFHIGMNCSFQSERRFRLPAGIRVAYLPPKVAVEKEFGSWALDYQTVASDPYVVVEKKSVLLRRQTIPVEKYGLYKAVYDDFVHRRNTIILLEKVQ
ncbi:MAG: DUF3857 and transglutaminase domain-containing protein [bacterium]|nr:DUF3857 and transglutaminase domain-containing protein [candidate division KSB1 bacterium]MDH7560251.1 DUF3857 and transglutaminase domain-containing protein [bacterium]